MGDDGGSRGDTARAALLDGPRRFLVSLWPLRTLAYTMTGILSGALTLVGLPIALLGGAVVATPLMAQPLAALERRRAVLLGGPPIADPHGRPDRPGLQAWLRARYAEAATWRELSYLVLHGTVLLAVDVTAIVAGLAPVLVFASGALTVVVAGPAPHAPPSGGQNVGHGVAEALLTAAFSGLGVLVVAVLVAYATGLAAVAHSELARLLLAPGDEPRVRTLTRSRARLIDAFEVERRRIERDLHDGAQQRLLHLGITLATAQLELDDNPEAARPLVAQAADEAKAALAELRELVRGIHPQVLTDLGLAAAVAELADRSTVPVTLALDLPDRLPSTVESAAYFVVAEALTNSAKHGQATQISVTGAVTPDRLLVEICDNGVGGADPILGSGLTGLADRVDALDGSLTLTSPPGGPTTLRLELPCSA